MKLAHAILYVLAVALLTACGNKEGDTPAATAEGAPATDSAPTAAIASATITATAAIMGPKSNRASYPEKGVDGGVIRDDKFALYHFNVAPGRLMADFAPSAISFSLSSPGTDNIYPVVKLKVSAPGDTEARELGSGTVKDTFTEKYNLKDAKPGIYTFSVWYGDTEPKANVRPVLTIDSVELLK